MNTPEAIETYQRALREYFPKGSRINLIELKRTARQVLVCVVAIDGNQVRDVSNMVAQVCGKRRGQRQGFWCQSTAELDSYLGLKLYNDHNALTNNYI